MNWKDYSWAGIWCVCIILAGWMWWRTGIAESETSHQLNYVYQATTEEKAYPDGISLTVTVANTERCAYRTVRQFHVRKDAFHVVDEPSLDFSYVVYNTKSTGFEDNVEITNFTVHARSRNDTQQGKIKLVESNE